MTNFNAKLVWKKICDYNKSKGQLFDLNATDTLCSFSCTEDVRYMIHTMFYYPKMNVHMGQVINRFYAFYALWSIFSWYLYYKITDTLWKTDTLCLYFKCHWIYCNRHFSSFYLVIVYVLGRYLNLSMPSNCLTVYFLFPIIVLRAEKRNRAMPCFNR